MPVKKSVQEANFSPIMALIPQQFPSSISTALSMRLGHEERGLQALWVLQVGQLQLFLNCFVLQSGRIGDCNFCAL